MDTQAQDVHKKTIWVRLEYLRVRTYGREEVRKEYYGGMRGGMSTIKNGGMRGGRSPNRHCSEIVRHQTASDVELSPNCVRIPDSRVSIQLSLVRV